MFGSSKAKHVLVLSDSCSLLDLFITRNKDRARLFTTDNYKGKESESTLGLHNLTAVDKEHMNIEMIIDFYLLTKAKAKVGDGKSLFFNMGKCVLFDQ